MRHHFLFAALLLASARPASAQQVLILSDGDAAAVEAALWDAGFGTQNAGLESQYDGTLDPSGNCAVVHLNGDTWNQAMPLSGQTALVSYVQEGGGYIGMEWNAYEETYAGTVTGMPDLVLFSRSSGHEGASQYDLTAAGLAHPVTAGLPASFPFSSGFSDGHCKAGMAIQVLATEGMGGPNDGVCVRELGRGRVVAFNHAGNYSTYDSFTDPNILQLLVQAVAWACSQAVESTCGDGVPEADEDCDDGNQWNTDACTNACESATCGDGFIRAGWEDCDDRNSRDGDGCSSRCDLEEEVVDAGMDSAANFDSGNHGDDAGSEADSGLDVDTDFDADPDPDAHVHLGDSVDDDGDDDDDGERGRRRRGCSATPGAGAIPTVWLLALVLILLRRR